MFKNQQLLIIKLRFLYKQLIYEAYFHMVGSPPFMYVCNLLVFFFWRVVMTCIGKNDSQGSHVVNSSLLQLIAHDVRICLYLTLI